MKKLLLLLSCAIIAACSTPNQPTTPVEGIDIDLAQLSNTYIDLSKYDAQVTLSGEHQGGRIVFRNTSGKTLIFRDATVNSSHAEDAICVDGDAKGLRFVGENWKMNKAITFWALAQNVTISGLRSSGSHTGIRATQNLPHLDIIIENCYINNTTHEGVYIGASVPGPEVRNVRVRNNSFSRIGWDAVQLGNCNHCYIEENVIHEAGQKKDYGQDYAITLNNCGLVFLNNNEIRSTPKHFQSIGSNRVFIHTKN